MNEIQILKFDILPILTFPLLKIAIITCLQHVHMSVKIITIL